MEKGETAAGDGVKKRERYTPRPARGAHLAMLLAEDVADLQQRRQWQTASAERSRPLGNKNQHLLWYSHLDLVARSLRRAPVVIVTAAAFSLLPACVLGRHPSLRLRPNSLRCSFPSRCSSRRSAAASSPMHTPFDAALCQQRHLPQRRCDWGARAGARGCSPANCCFSLLVFQTPHRHSSTLARPRNRHQDTVSALRRPRPCKRGRPSSLRGKEQLPI